MIKAQKYDQLLKMNETFHETMAHSINVRHSKSFFLVFFFFNDTLGATIPDLTLFYVDYWIIGIARSISLWSQGEDGFGFGLFVPHILIQYCWWL